ncbi:P1 family peptidase [Thermovenabulum gondwanense]|uniref:Beta-peptidyl aminopeptidase BapA n=1 Tax=Thermovenabulum gondwanense TaxID=520767 RepID=A0A162MS85_9FIRM|nr:P1 family peptidase [Thermovenabulum gondwanense]KYO67063.1 Beta-peptidyl aminopeptidase BapA [Thermovenabulum gondwanense]
MRKRMRDYGICVGQLPPGQLNSISDVKGVRVGHSTVIYGEGKLIPEEGPARTGVTAVIPRNGNLFKEKLLASCFVGNGFGKSVGLMQIRELGTLETPVILTNTLSVGIASNALIEYMLSFNEDIGITTGTVNPVVMECNDGYLNDIRGRHIKKEHVFEALNNASLEFETGSVGAGTGMICHGFKGGIGTSSRQIEIDGNIFTIGALLLTNYGRMEDLTFKGKNVGRLLKQRLKDKEEKNGIPKDKDDGSCIIIIATDLPLDNLMLERIAKRGILGLARTGSFMGNGSGDIVLAFSTANKIDHYGENLIEFKTLSHHCDAVDLAFQAAVEAVEEAVWDSLFTAEKIIGRDGHEVPVLPVEEFLNLID